MGPARRFLLRLLGSPTIVGIDEVLVRGPAAQRHRLALLALLALAEGRPIGRERLLGYLWPERDSDSGRQLLKQAVYQLRKRLGEGAILSGHDDLRLDPGIVGTDVVEFQAALEEGDWARGVTLYGGPFLEGFFLSEAPEFEEWAERQRTRLAGAYGRALVGLAEAAERSRDFDEAVTWWRAKAEQDPFDSRAALRLMRALEASGCRADALRHADAHQRLLREEVGAEPDPDVLALAERLRSGPAPRREPLPELGAASRPDASSVPALPLRARSPRELGRWLPVRYKLVLSAVVFVFAALWLMGRMEARDVPPVPPEPAVAVLPLRDLGGGSDRAALADGMTESLITMLGRTGDVRVIARTSVSGFRDHNVDVRRIADSLGVTHVLEGALQRMGTRLRVEVRLVEALSGMTVWSETYDRELRDVFAVQNEIARSVATELGARLPTARGNPARGTGTTSVAAYELYLRGSDPSLERSDSTAREALAYFERAIALDSSYAAAWAGLAGAAIRVASTVAGPDRTRYHELAERAGHRAVALDDSLATGYAELGVIRMRSFDPESAERYLTRALRLDPTVTLAYEWLVGVYIWTGRPEAALSQAQRAVALDPLSPRARAAMAQALLHNDRCEEALITLDELEPLDPPLLRAGPLAALCHARKGRWAEAIAVLRPQAATGEPNALALLGYMLARAGRTEEAEGIAARLESSDELVTNAFQVAVVHAGLGDLDRTFTWLEQAMANDLPRGVPGLTLNVVILGPLLEELRDDPRFAGVRERLGMHAR